MAAILHELQCAEVSDINVSIEYRLQNKSQPLDVTLVVNEKIWDHMFLNSLRPSDAYMRR